MIKGTANLEFGTGDIEIITRCSQDNSSLYFKNQVCDEIGVFKKVFDGYDYDNCDVVMTFSKVESIDTLIEQLLFIKRRMKNEI